MTKKKRNTNKDESVESYIKRVVLDKERWLNHRIKDLKKKKRFFDIIKRVYIVETKIDPDMPDKIIVLDEIQFHDNKEIRLRFGYYIRTAEDGIKWGQRELSISRKDYLRLLLEAKKNEIDVPEIKLDPELFSGLIGKLQQRKREELTDQDLDYCLACIEYRGFTKD